MKVTGFSGEDPSPALVSADIVLISAGVARKPGMDRSDLFNINAGIVKNLVSICADTCPKALIGIITNPVNTTVAIAASILKQKGVYDPARLFGITTLDIIRSNTFVAEVNGVNPEDVNVPVIGGHSGITILPLLSQSGFQFNADGVTVNGASGGAAEEGEGHQARRDQAPGRRGHLPRRQAPDRAGQGPPGEPGLRHRPSELRHELFLHQSGARPDRAVEQRRGL